MSLSSILDRVRGNMTGHRTELLEYRQWLTAQLHEVDLAISGIDQVLGLNQVAAPAGKPEGHGRGVDEKDLLRRQITEVLKADHPAGLTSYELQQRILPDWTGSELTVRQIGANATQMVRQGEITGDGERWYYVPADPPQEEEVLK